MNEPSSAARTSVRVRGVRRRALATFLLTMAVASPSTGRTGTGEPPPAAEDAPMAEHADEVASYTLRASLDPDLHTVHGEGTITWRNPSKAPVSELWLHLYLNAFKNQRSVFMRAPVGGFRGGAVPSAWGSIDLKRLVLRSGDERTDLLPKLELRRPNDDDETDARVPLPAEVPPDGRVVLEVEWDDKLPSIVERTGFHGSFHMVAQWFPKIAAIEPNGTFAHFPFHHLGEFYADFGTYDVTVDVPEAFLVGATGPAIESRIEGGRRIERHVQADVHDFAWTAWDAFRTRKEKIEGIDVTVLSPPGYGDAVERELETLRFAIPHYGKRYGPYPYPVLTVVHPPAAAAEAGGMEYPTLITSREPSWTPRGLHLLEIVTIHEFGHQYFYGLLASNEDAWPFLDEGLNQYAENEALVAWKGRCSAIDLAGLCVGDIEAQAERARHFGHDEKIAQGAGEFATGNSYGALVYSRTATLLETMARTYGKPALDRALALYTRRFRFKHPTPQDLVATIRETMGPRAAENAVRALFDKGWVDYAITQMSSYPSHGAAGMFDRDGTRETISPDRTQNPHRYDGWALVVRRGTLRFPVDVELIGEDGARSRVRWDGESESYRVPWSGTSALRAAVVDPDDAVLLDDHPDDDWATAVNRGRAGAPRAFERATFWAATLLGGLAP
jgi:hypothetical protein